MRKDRVAYLNGALVPHADARIHVGSEAVGFGSSVYEGYRGYWNEKLQKLYVFRMHDHITRLLQSARMMRFEHSIGREELERSITLTLRENRVTEDVGLRQNLLLESEGIHDTGPIGLSVVARASPSNVSAGQHACVSSWMRISDASMPPRIKCSGNYQNSRLAMLEARTNGYDVPIFLNSRARVCETPGACLFMFRNGALVTPPATADILESVTRDSVLQLAESELGLRTEVRDIDRTELYVCDECFIVGTTWEIIPILSVDKLSVGPDGSVGETTKAVQDSFFSTARGENPKYSDWLTEI